MYRNNQSRRGVILIVVLGMLALFALMAVTFVIVARQSRMSSHIDAKLDLVGDPPDRAIDDVFKQLLRGTNNPNSVLRHVSLLEDMYGNDEVLGRVATAPRFAGTDDGVAFGKGKVIEFYVTFDSDIDSNGDPSRNYVAQYYGYFNGLVLTMSGGAADGQSTRIVDYFVIPSTKAKDPPQRRVQVLAFENGALPAKDDLILINGRPFNGTGYGYARASFDTSSGSPTFLLDARNDQKPLDTIQPEYALLPNPVFFTGNTSGSYTDPAGPGGADEDYDAPDFQNLLLGAYVWNGSSMDVHIPSLHRPALVNYWIKQANLGSPTNVKKPWNDVDDAVAQALRRTVNMRPSSLDHFNDLNGDGRRNENGKVFTEPDFAGRMGALEFDPTSTDPANWEVDNDGDGVPDSVWVDAGLPVQSAPDGRLFKPMFAVLCVDMDGKINLNAQGTIHHAVAASGNYVDQRNLAAAFADNSGGVTNLPVGQGYGPAEINPAAPGSLFPITDPGLYDQTVSMKPADTLRRLLIGYSEINDASLPAANRVGEFAISGRYGEIPGNDTSRPGMSSSPVGVPGLQDFVHGLSQWETPYDYWNTLGVYGSPSDISGDGAIAYDLVGQPLYVSNNRVPNPNDNSDVQLSGLGEAGDNFNDPYEIDLSKCAAHTGYVPAPGPETLTIDTPFSVYELERVLRFHDPDVRDLPDRIVRLTEPLMGVRPSNSSSSLASALKVNEFTPLLDTPDMQLRRRLVTTCSFDLPTYGLSPLTHTAISDVNAVLSNAGPNDAVPSFPPRTIVDLLAARLQAEMGSINGPHHLRNAMLAPKVPVVPGQPGVFRSFDALISPELLAGLRMDINRPFGNGRDDTGNGIVDEPFEDGVAQTLWQAPVLASADLNNDGGLIPPAGSPGEDGILIRQRYARHLYVLARLMLDKEFTQLAGQLQLNDPNITSQQDAEAEAARRFAQWAINVVDYRDADSIMTPFPYDIYPFSDQTSDMSPNIFTWDITTTYQAAIPNQTGIVWGMERPELLITETLATHDRRTRDTSAGDGNTKTTTDPNYRDPHFDQLRRPVGSLFVELFNPTGLNEHTPAEFYENVGDGPGVRLDKQVPGGDPVWRLAIVDPSKLQTAGLNFDSDVFHRTPNLNESVIPNNFIDRTVFFTTLPPAPSVLAQSNDPFHRKGTAPIVVQRQQYAVIGPADKTEIQGDQSPNTGFSIRIDEPPYTRRKDSGVEISKMSYPYPSAGEAMRQAVGVVINSPRRLSISEPYANPVPSNKYDTWDSMNDSSVSADVESPLPDADDEPWDFGTNELEFTGTYTGEPDPTPNKPDIGYRIVALQRLADPTRPFDPQQNPYLTVDSLPVDLTAYTGEAPPMASTVEPGFVEDDFRFGSRQRDGVATVAGLGTVPNLWKCVADKPELNEPADDTVGTKRVQTLGYLNGPYKTAANGSRTRASLAAPNFDDYVGAPGNGATGKPFSTFLWPNRPFVSNTELMNVPWAGPAEVFSEFSLWPDSPASATDPKPYNRGAAGNPGTAPDYLNAPNRHLQNYHDSSAPNYGNLPTGLNFHRLLEFVQVPSRFAGTKEMLPPDDFTVGNHTFHPPFDFLSRYRDPGRVNLNTILDDGKTLRAIMNGTEVLNTAWGSNPNTLWNRLVDSRRGTVGGPVDPFGALAPGIPTYFPNPFRSYSGGNLVPIAAMQRPNMVDSTLLRPDPTNPNQPMFTFDPQQAYLNGDTNANVRNLVYQKLGNMVTTRSNVYAIWITMGYFEVEAPNVPNPAAYPDGYRLKQELGVETGEIERHRSFYIIDRTIPVGFLRGEDTNVEKTILLKRFIE